MLPFRSAPTSRAFTPVLAALALLLSASAQAAGAQATYGFAGGADAANSFPFGGYPSESRYQQAYLGSVFGTAPVRLAGVRFFDDESGAAALQGGRYTLRLSTTTRDLTAGFSGLSNIFAENVGADAATVFDGTLAATVVPENGFVTITFSTPFLFDPAGGNLLLDVLTGSLGAGSAANAFDAVNGSDVTSRVYGSTGPGSGFVGAGTGLRTEFLAQSTVPEPGTWALLGTGLVALGAVARRRRA